MSDDTNFDKIVILPEPASKETVEDFYNAFKDFLKPTYLYENVVANGPQWEISQKFDKLDTEAKKVKGNLKIQTHPQGLRVQGTLKERPSSGIGWIIFFVILGFMIAADPSLLAFLVLGLPGILFLAVFFLIGRFLAKRYELHGKSDLKVAEERVANAIAHATAVVTKNQQFPTTPPIQTPTSLSRAAELKEFSLLHAEGTLTDEEFQAEKARILGGGDKP